MATKKYDWIQIKEHYFQSEVDEVTSFFQENYAHIPSRTWRPMTVGWRDEKQKFKAELLKVKQGKLKHDPEIQSLQQQLLIAKNNIVKRVAKLLGDAQANFTVNDLPKVEIGWKILKTELGEPTSVNVNRLANEDGKPLQVEGSNKLEIVFKGFSGKKEGSNES